MCYDYGDYASRLHSPRLTQQKDSVSASKTSKMYQVRSRFSLILEIPPKMDDKIEARAFGTGIPSLSVRFVQNRNSLINY